MSCFVIADITSPRSVPLELEATVPDNKIPFVPIIQKGKPGFSMFTNLQGGIGELLPIDALTVRCRMPRNCSIAANLNSPGSAIAIRSRGFGTLTPAGESSPYIGGRERLRAARRRRCS